MLAGCRIGAYGIEDRRDLMASDRRDLPVGFDVVPFSGLRMNRRWNDDLPTVGSERTERSPVRPSYFNSNALLHLRASERISRTRLFRACGVPFKRHRV